jgi:hypothetical protein
MRGQLFLTAESLGVPVRYVDQPREMFLRVFFAIILRWNA